MLKDKNPLCEPKRDDICSFAHLLICSFAYLPILLFFSYISCTTPPQAEDPSANPRQLQLNLAEKIAPPQIVPSRHKGPRPPILAVNYVETIGRPGQGTGQFLYPAGLALDLRGQLYVADSGNNRIQVVGTDGHFTAEYGTRGWRTGEFDQPTDVALHFQRTETLYVVDVGNSRIQHCNLIDRVFYVTVGELTNDAAEGVGGDRSNEFDRPGGISTDRNGSIYVADSGNNRFIKFNKDGLPVLVRGGFGGGSEQFREPTGCVIDTSGNIYIVDSGNHRIKKYDFSGSLIKIWGSQGNALGQFRDPNYIALDQWNYVYVTDRENRRVQIFTPDGQVLTEFGSKVLFEPVGIAISKNDQVFVSDSAANNIKIFQIVYRRADEQMSK